MGRFSWTVIPDGSTSIVKVEIEETVDSAIAETFARELVIKIAEGLGQNGAEVREQILRDMLEGPK